MAAAIKPGRSKPRKRGRIYCAHCDVHFGETEIPALQVTRALYQVDGELVCFNCLEWAWMEVKKALKRISKKEKT